MSPLVPDGAEINVDPSPIGLGALVVLRSPASTLPLIKRVVAAPGQSLDVRDGHIIVDGTEAVTSTGAPYHLPSNRAALLALYAGVLKPGTYLILGDDPSGTDDSSLFGLVHASSIIGVATLIGS